MSYENKIPLDDIQLGPIRHPVLPDSVVERIRAFKATLGAADGASLGQTIDNFKPVGKDVPFCSSFVFIALHQVSGRSGRTSPLRSALCISSCAAPTSPAKAAPGNTRSADAGPGACTARPIYSSH